MDTEFCIDALEDALRKYAAPEVARSHLFCRNDNEAGLLVATAVDPAILLIDEGIGAGDSGFADRAAQRMRSFIDSSKIPVFASHNEDMIRAWCNKGALFAGGKLLNVGDAEDVLAACRAAAYTGSISSKNAADI